MTDLKHLKRLSKIKSNTGIQFLTPAVSTGNDCPMRFASEIVENIADVSSLIVGMQECATYSRFYSPEPEGEGGELHWLYTLDANEVVFGCREGLIDALKKMDAAGAEAILVIATCIPELIGEDIEGIIHEVQPELSARVAFTMLGQFKNLGYVSGTRKTMEALATLMEAQETDPHRINVLINNSNGRRRRTPSLLSALWERGFSLRRVGPGATLEDFYTAPDAALNLVLSDSTLPLAVKMEKEFGVPYIALHGLYDVADIDRAYEDIARRLGFSWNGEFEEERQWALELQDQAGDWLQGLRSVFAGRVESPLALAGYLGRLGMEPLLVHLEEYSQADSVYSRELAGMDFDPLIGRIMSPEADIPILESLEPDICLGRMEEKSSEQETNGHRGRGGYHDEGGYRGKGGHRGIGGYHDEGGYRGRGGHRGRGGYHDEAGYGYKGDYRGKGSRMQGKGGKMKGRSGWLQGSSIPYIVPPGGGMAGYGRTARLLTSIMDIVERTDVYLRRAS